MAPERLRHSSQFRVRRTQNWLAMGFTYAAMYMARYNFGFANKALSDTYGWSRAQIGGIISVATLMLRDLGAVQRATGRPLRRPQRDADRGHRRLHLQLLFGLGRLPGLPRDRPLLLGYLATIWTLNMYFQSYSALALIKVNSGWFHVSERGVFSAVFGSMIQSGARRCSLS